MFPGYSPGGLDYFGKLQNSLMASDSIGSNSYNSFLKSAGPAVGDVGSAVSNMAPYANAGLNLVNSLASGQMMKHPIGTIGSIAGGLGGTLGGAALGAELGSVVPGIGNVIGAAGGALGSKLGSLLGGK
jgi:phage tail tape-measure protein